MQHLHRHTQQHPTHCGKRRRTKTIFAFVSAQNSRKIQQKASRAFFRQFCVCSGNRLCGSDIRNAARYMCNKNNTKTVRYCPENALFDIQKHIYWHLIAYILRTNSIYIGTQLYIY